MVDDDLLKALHHVLLEVRKSCPPGILPLVVHCAHKIHIDEGQMTCPNCNHVYPISNGIPNMVRRSTPTCHEPVSNNVPQLLAEHEIA